MTEPPDLLPADAADVVALADDCLGPCRRAEVEARVAADPQLAAALALQRRALALLAGVAPCPSAALRERVHRQAPRPAPRRAAFGLLRAR